jgi:hypothetical protein
MGGSGQLFIGYVQIRQPKKIAEERLFLCDATYDMRNGHIITDSTTKAQNYFQENAGAKPHRIGNHDFTIMSIARGNLREHTHHLEDVLRGSGINTPVNLLPAYFTNIPTWLNHVESAAREMRDTNGVFKATTTCRILEARCIRTVTETYANENLPLFLLALANYEQFFILPAGEKDYLHELFDRPATSERQQEMYALLERRAQQKALPKPKST